MFWNEVTGSVIGLSVAGIAFLVTGKDHLAASPRVRAGDADPPPL